MKRIMNYKAFESLQRDPNSKNQIEMSSQYSWEAVPDEYTAHPTGHGGVEVKEIGIGSRDPIQKFKDWNGKYWRKEQDKEKNLEMDV